MNKISEPEIQKTFKGWCDKQDFILLHWHVPNGMKSSVKEGVKFKRSGLKKGIPDYWVLLNNKKLVVIEFKTDEGILSSDQKKILKILDYCNIPNKVCRSAHEAVLFIKENL